MALSTYNQTQTSVYTRWDVFLSFRGIDTRNKFTDHLYNALDRTGIQTFRDDPELRSGEVISDALIQAIYESKTYVVVFSKNYAFSRWCLDELAEIYNCYISLGRLVVPVFFNVEPAEVRHHIGSFGKAFAKQQSRFDAEQLNKWRSALSKVGNLSGYHISKDVSQADIINKIVDRVLLDINPMTLDVAKYPVGLDSRVKEITTLLSSEAAGVMRIGIHGMGGVGKTTLAKAVYNQNYQRFQGSCFLADVRDVSVTEKGIVCLQQQLVDDVLKYEKIRIRHVDQGIMLIRARICSKKVMIVIDDLDDPKPLEFIVGPFGLGSRIIITTRNEDLLDSIKVEARYKVNELGDTESRQLFRQHAFGDNNIPNKFTDMSNEILERAGGLPLALKVFGSNLLNQSEEGWRWLIDKLRRVSIDDIEKKLIVSFDALKLVDPMLQDIFLDIACCFIGQKKDDVLKILETCYTCVSHNLNILMKRCLLTINEYEELGMHDLLRDVGREIAHKNSLHEPGKHSRLWVSRDIYDVLDRHKGTEAIEVIKSFYTLDERIERTFSVDTFNRMSKLRILYLNGESLTGSFEQKFENLRVLCWHHCPLTFLPSDFCPQNLVILKLEDSKMRTLWELNTGTRAFKKLKTLDMSYSMDLTKTPDFTKLPCLEYIDFRFCTSLEEVHESIGSLARLVYLNLDSCGNRISLPDTICNLRALEFLHIGQCKLKALPVELGRIKSLTTLKVCCLAISELPYSFGHLSKLVDLDLSYNRNLETLPDTICNLRALKYLNISKCSTLKTLPDTICNLRAMEVLDISDCLSLKAFPTELGNIESLKRLIARGLAILELPDSIGCLCNLIDLNLSDNKNLETLPDTICNLRALEWLNISDCPSLKAFPTELGNIESLKRLIAPGLAILELPDSIGCLCNLIELSLSYNKILETLPDAICNLRALEYLDISNCPSLKELPIELGNMESLNKLYVMGLEVSKLPESIGRLSNLVELILKYSKNLETLPDTICNLRALELLDISGCQSLKAYPTELGNIESLKRLIAPGLTILELPDSIGCLCNLIELNLSYNKNLETLPDPICYMRSLKSLDISGCANLEILPNQLWKITILEVLYANGVIFKNLPDIELSQIASSLKTLDLADSVFTALPFGISQLSNLENLGVENCHQLLSITELPNNLKYISAKGCTSMVSLQNLSSLKQLRKLNLSDCTSLKDIQGLEELTSITELHLGGCNSSILAYTFTKHLFQIYSGFGHETLIYTSPAEIPDWISQSSNVGSTLSLNLLPIVSHNFLATIFWFKYMSNTKLYSYCAVKNTTTGFRWTNSVHDCHDAIITIVPKSIFPVRNGDDKIELTVKNADIVGIHLLYKTDITMTDSNSQ